MDYGMRGLVLRESTYLIVMLVALSRTDRQIGLVVEN